MQVLRIDQTGLRSISTATDPEIPVEATVFQLDQRERTLSNTMYEHDNGILVHQLIQARKYIYEFTKAHGDDNSYNHQIHL